jgi:ubiquinone/menaquinone biosynthesis C-methylase UbiE
MMDSKNHSRQRFGAFAERYVHSPIHAAGEDLNRMVEVITPQNSWLALDVATGGGHTALAFAPHVRRMIATDYTPPMLEAARSFIHEQGAQNVDYVPADAENLPFASDTFDLVTCRVAAHHFPDCYRFVCEAARVLKRGGVLAVLDHVLPEDKRPAEYIEAFEKLRDPSHHRAFSDSEWRGMFLDAELSVDHVEELRRTAGLVAWAERQNRPAYIIERLHIMLAQAPRDVAEFIRPTHIASPDASFDHVFILITGRKP